MNECLSERNKSRGTNFTVLQQQHSSSTKTQFSVHSSYISTNV